MAMMKRALGSTLTALQKAEAQVQLLRQRAASERTAQLKDLHVTFGFSSRGELIDALVALDGSGRRSNALARGGATPIAGRKSKRARVTPEMKSEIIKAIKAGDSGAAVAKRFGVSSQTVQNIKTAAGLVKARKRKATK